MVMKTTFTPLFILLQFLKCPLFRACLNQKDFTKVLAIGAIDVFAD